MKEGQQRGVREGKPGKGMCWLLSRAGGRLSESCPTSPRNRRDDNGPSSEGEADMDDGSDSKENDSSRVKILSEALALCCAERLIFSRELERARGGTP